MSVISQKLADRNQTGPAQNPGHRRRVIPDTLDLSIVDRVEQVSNDERLTTHGVCTQEGIISGISSGAAVRPLFAWQASRVRGQDHRCGAAGLRRTISQHGSF